MKELTHQVQRVLDKINSEFPIKNHGKQKTVELKKNKNRNLIYQEFYIQQICSLKM